MKTNSHWRTVQSCFKDMQFHEKEGVIPYKYPTKVFLQARTVTIFLDTQKNNIMYESTTMEATDLDHGNPVSAAAR